MPLTSAGEKQICRNCQCKFGSDEAVRCGTCHSYICPNCGECNCARVKPVFKLLREQFGW